MKAGDIRNWVWRKTILLCMLFALVATALLLVGEIDISKRVLEQEREFLAKQKELEAKMKQAKSAPERSPKYTETDTGGRSRGNENSAAESQKP